MNVPRLFNRKLFRWRTLHKAVTICVLVSLLAGLIPPPLARSVAESALPAPLAEPVTNAIAGLLPQASVARAYSSIPTATQIAKYLVVGMGDDDHIDNAFQMSNSEIGADRHVLSNSEDVWPPDVTSSFPNILSIYESRWITSTAPHRLTDHDLVFEGIDWSGNVALTSDNSSFDSANSLVFADFGIGTAAAKSQFDSVDAQSKYFADGNSTTPVSLLTAGTSKNNNFSTLLAELAAWKTFINGLTAEATITKAQIESDFVNNMASNGSGGLRTTYADSLDTNNDGIILINVNPQDIDFNITNTDWVVNGTGNKLLIFRINDGANMNMSNVSITLGTGGIANLGAGMIFYQDSEAADSPESSDAVFNGDNVILDGGAFWDLNDVGESAGGGDGHNIVINNGQGCWQFISQKVNFQNNRWNKCTYAPAVASVDWGDLPDDDATAGDDSPTSPGYNTNSTGTAGSEHAASASSEDATRPRKRRD